MSQGPYWFDGDIEDDSYDEEEIEVRRNERAKLNKYFEDLQEWDGVGVFEIESPGGTDTIGIKIEKHIIKDRV
jgi:hypothetical protein